MKRFFLLLFISQGILFLLIFYVGFSIGRKYGNLHRPSLKKVSIENTLRGKESVPSLRSSSLGTPFWNTLGLGKNQFLLVQGNLFFLCALDKKENINIKKVFALKYDPRRYPKDGSQIAFHHYYFDNIERPILKLIRKKEKRFLELGKKSPYILDYTLEAIQIGEDLASYGDISFLMSFLEEKHPYRLQKAAALALGKRGYIQAIPILITLAKEKDLVQRQKVFSLFRRLTRLDIPKIAKGKKVAPILERVKKWYQKEKASFK